MVETALTWIDTHVHWDAEAFDADRDAALRRARLAGVTHCLNPSVTLSSAVTVQALATQSATRADWPRILPAFGIHPLYVAAVKPDDLPQLDEWLRKYRPIALGEIGLDAYAGAPDFGAQQQVFEAQLELAAAHQLPVLLHSRHAVEAVIQTLKRFQGRQQKIPGGIAHAFNGSEVQATQLISMGFLLGFGGSLTYDGSTRIRHLACHVPIESIALETDAPDMSPAWLQGGRNESAELPKIACMLAALRDVAPAVLAQSVQQNLHRLLGPDDKMVHAHTQTVSEL